MNSLVNTGERLGLGLLGFPGLGGTAELGRAAEAAGFESVWVAETRITRDAVTGMTTLLLSTDRLRIGSASVNVFTRGAALTATTWTTMAEAAPGRVVLGVGPGSPGPLAQQGYAFDHPLGRLCEFTEAVRAIWRGKAPVGYPGRFVRVEGLIPELAPDPCPPVYFCVTGPRALAAAGRLADGVVLNAFLQPGYTERAGRLLDEGAGGCFTGETAGALVVGIADSVADAVARVRPVLADYLVHFPHLAQHTGIDPELLEDLRARADEEGIAAASRRLPDRIVTRHALCGTAHDCRDGLEEYRAAGLDLPILFPDPPSIRPLIEYVAGQDAGRRGRPRPVGYQRQRRPGAP